MNMKLTIRPYARLLTMLGDQLIKNEQIAVLELIKNAYDADAEWVLLSFENFNSDGSCRADSKIVIEDNGEGMTKDIIEKAWMSPATPNKFSNDGKVRLTNKKRIVQGEKGIGRYAMLKLGHKIKMTTRPINTSEEYSILLDFSSYGEDYVRSDEDGKNMYLDELAFELNVSSPKDFIERSVFVGNHKFSGPNNSHGTRLEITELQGKWNNAKITSVAKGFIQFGDFFNEIIKENDTNDFRIGVYVNNEPMLLKSSNETTLANLIDSESVFQIKDGHYDSKNGVFKYCQNGVEKVLDCNSSEIRGLKVFKNAFFDKETKLYREISNFGDFDFDFYIFDFNAKLPSKYALVDEAKKIIKQHRVYLLRDGVRVMPYGDPTDDWLQVDMGRGTISAGAFFSNDQLVGRIQISKENNPHLKDKTNREGLIEEDNYTSDFIAVISSFLSYLRVVDYKRYLDDNKQKQTIDKANKQQVNNEFKKIKDYFKNDKQATKLIAQLEKEYNTEYRYLDERANRTEALAAVGLSVETASHDMMMLMNKGLDQLQALVSDSMYGSIETSKLFDELQKIFGIFSFVKSQMKDMQLLFTSSKQRRRQLRINDYVDKVLAIYKRTLRENSISCKVNKIGPPLVAKCTDADILQVLINLLDNSVYWLIADKRFDRQIEITLDGNRCAMIFSDNGPGIKNEDIPYIFEAFYSGKGEEGRGLGLYISRKLMERNEYSIELADLDSEKVLNGANFIVSFIKQKD